MPPPNKDYKILSFRYENGLVIFEVEHFYPDGNLIGKQNYLFQGRQGHRSEGLSWKSVLSVIDSIHPKMVSGEVKPDVRNPKIGPGESRDLTGIEEQRNKETNLKKISGLRRSIGDPDPPGIK